MLKRLFMAKRRSAQWIGSRLCLVFLLVAPLEVRGETALPTPTPTPVAEAPGRPPLVVGVAIDEGGMTEGDLERSRDLILALLESLPPGSEMALASFSGDKRIVLPPTSDRDLLASSLATFKAGSFGVALPDGLFDMVEYLASLDSDSRALLLVSAGKVRAGDLQFDDPLNAATSNHIPIFALALGQGDGKLLRRIAKITGGEYVRLEVADAPMLARALAPPSDSIPAVPRSAAPESPAEQPEPKPSAGLLGAAAIFFSLGGLLMLGIAALLIRRLGASAPSKAPAIAAPSPPSAQRSAGRSKDLAVKPEDETILEKTLVVNANPILRALSGPVAGQNFSLSVSGRTSIGRSRRNDIVVPEDAASAQHCRIDREGDSYVLHDLGATNGSWVNGTRTERAVLQHGDRLKVGETVFAVSLFGDRT